MTKSQNKGTKPKAARAYAIGSSNPPVTTVTPRYLAGLAERSYPRFPFQALRPKRSLALDTSAESRTFSEILGDSVCPCLLLFDFVCVIQFT